MVEPGNFIGDSCLELKNFVGLLTPIGVGISGPFHVISREAERRCYQADENSLRSEHPRMAAHSTCIQVVHNHIRLGPCRVQKYTH